jgi:hypothetical protein
VAGRQHELHGLAADGRDAEDSASEKAPAAREALVRFETLYFFE